MNRIVIIGNAGSGKSMLAQRLHAISKIPVYHLDQYYWKPQWRRQDPVEFKKAHDRLCDYEQWIIDGPYLKHLDYRIRRATLIIVLDIPRYRCFWRIFKRMWKYYGTTAPTASEGCVEQFNWNFLLFLKWVFDFNKKYSHAIQDIAHQYPEKQLYILKSLNQIDAFLYHISLQNPLIIKES